MISVRLIGGLGNQMSCISAVYKVKETYPNYKPVLCESLIDGSCYKHSSSLYFGSFIHLSVDRDIIPDDTWVTVDEDSYQQFDWKGNTTNVILSGYYQGFWHLPSRSFLSYAFKCDEMPTFDVDASAVGIHIRRGDYMEHEWLYGNQRNVRYWTKALQYMEQRLGKSFPLYVFTNDLLWTKEFMKAYLHHSIVYVSDMHLKDYQEMMLISKLNNMIISNSTFSWWGVVLSEHTPSVVCPFPFYFNYDSHLKYYGPDWICIS